jgi:hypothetical protein
MLNNEIQSIIDKEGIRQLLSVASVEEVNTHLKQGWIIITLCTFTSAANFLLGLPKSPKCDGGSVGDHEAVETTWNHDEAAYICPKCQLHWKRKQAIN